MEWINGFVCGMLCMIVFLFLIRVAAGGKNRDGVSSFPTGSGDVALPESVGRAEQTYGQSSTT